MASVNNEISCDAEKDIDKIRGHVTDSQHNQITRTLRNGKRVHITANTGQQLVCTSRAPLSSTTGTSIVESNSSSNVFPTNMSCGGNANNETTNNRLNGTTTAKLCSDKSTYNHSLDHQTIYDSNSDKEFVAQEIIDKQKAHHWKEKRGIWLYRVKWKRNNEYKMTWETEGHCDINCPELVRQFEQKWNKTHISGDNTHKDEHKRSVLSKRKTKHRKVFPIPSEVALNKSPNGEFYCDLSDCSFKTKYEFSFVRHKRNHKIKCDHNDCSYKALNQFSLKRHKMTHTGEKPYKCEWRSCDARFRQRSHLNKHLLWHRKCDLTPIKFSHLFD